MEGKERISIQHPEAWELLVSINDKQVDYILFTPAVAGSLITGAVQVDGDTLQALEDAVYDTPELLGEYKRVRIVVHSTHYVLLPIAAADGDCLALVREAFPDDDGDAAVCPLPGCGVKLAYLMPRGMQAFIGRTFNYPVTVHHLAPLCEHFKELNRGDDIARMFLHLDGTCMNVAIYRGGSLQMANTYSFSNAQDAAYYALNAWRTYGLDQLTDELQLAGDSDTRAVMTPVLRDYIKYVMPAVYPAAAMRLGRNAMQAPLELILMALCE